MVHFECIQVIWLGHPACKSTWEPASALSPSLVADFEAGIAKEAVTVSESTYGHTSTTVVMKDNSSQEPVTKKAKVDAIMSDKERLVMQICVYT